MVQSIRIRKVFLLFVFCGAFLLKVSSQVLPNRGRMVPAKVLSTEQGIMIGKFSFNEKVILAETASKDTVGILYDSTIFNRHARSFRISKDSTYLFNILNPEGGDIDCKNYNLYIVSDFIPLNNPVWRKYVEAFKNDK